MIRRMASLLVFAGACSAQSIPTPESILGHKPGDDFYLASYDESREYFRALAKSSDRIKLINVGKTTRGLDWEIAIISSPANLAKLDRYKEISQRLAQGRGLDDAAAHALAREGKAIVHIDGGLHSTEVAGAQQSIALAYKLVSAKGDPDIDSILDNVILMLWPTLNPDGQNEVVSWYRKNVGTPFEIAPLPDLYQEYVGHDNNRDGYMNNMLESRDVTKTELEWAPVIFYCHHQTAPFPTRIFIPPFTEPISSNIHPLMARWLNVMGINMAAYLDEHSMPGAVHRVGFDNWYPGFLDFTHIFRNSISFFTETALYSYATPHFYSVNDFPRDRQQLRSEIFYSSPWKGGWWRLSDAVRYMLGASMSVLDTAARHRESLLYNRYQAARDNIAKFRQEPPFAYVIPREQRDLNTAGVLVEKLLINGIEVHQATRPFAANGREYKDAWVVLMDQPFSPLVKELFEKQEYPDLRTTPNGPPIRPYDVAGWTLPMQMGVEVVAVLTPVGAELRSGLRLVNASVLPPGTVQGSGAAYVLSRNTNAGFRLMNEALLAGAQASFAKDGIVLSGVSVDRAAELARKHSLPLQAVAQKPADAVATRKPRLGLYRAWQPSIDEGWSRWILEDYGFAPITLRNGDVQAGHLRDRFDAILIADSTTRSIMDGYLPGTIPGEYSGGVGAPGAEALRNFVREGGTLITFNNATLFAIEQFHLPVTNVLANLNPDQFYCSGSLLRVEMRDPAHPVAAGMPRDPIVMFERGPAFDTRTGFRGNVLATYPRDENPLASGYLLHPERIQGRAAALEVFYGEGRIYLFGFRPQWRGQSHGTYKFFFNAIYDSPASARPTAAPRAAVSSNAPADPLRALTARVRGDLGALLAQNRAFFAARGQAALDERAKLNTAIDAFEKDRIQEVQDTSAGLEGDAKRKASDLVRAMRRAAADLRSKEIEASVDADALAERYGIQE
jgi:Zinc carboxypeptidase